MYTILHAATEAVVDSGVPNEIYYSVGALLIAIISWLLGKKKGNKK